MKILHVIDNLGIGGAEKLLIDFIKEYSIFFPQDEHYIVTLRGGDNILLPLIAEKVKKHHCINFSKKNIFYSIYALRKFIRKNNIQIIHTHLFYSTIISRLANLGNNKVPLVSTYHNMEYSKESPTYSWKFPLIDRLTFFSKKYHLIFVSHAIAKKVTECVPRASKFSIIPNFVSDKFYRAYEFRDRNEIKLVSVGNLKKVKNYQYALEELSLLNDSRVSLDIYGSGSLKPELQSFINKNSLQVNIKENVEITSHLLAGYDAFLMPSLSEGMPVALIEAIITGLPSLVSDLPQLRETAQKAGIYFTLQKGELSKLLQKILSDRDILRSASENTLLLKDNFEVKQYIYKVRNIYNALS